MKISAMPAGNAGTPGIDLGNIHVGATASASKLAAARAISQGHEPIQEERDALLERADNIRRIKMRTNFSTNRDDSMVAGPNEADLTTNSAISDKDGQAQSAVESTQPLSPQFAALAKQRRALQVKERELAEREAKITEAPNAGEYVAKADILANPLKIFDLGLTYDQLTEAILASQSGFSPELKALKDELKAVKDGIETKFASQAEVQEEAALHSIADEIDSLSKEGDQYELIRSHKAIGAVLNRIYTHYKKTGEVLDTERVMNEVEEKLLERDLKLAGLGKVKSKLAPLLPAQSQPQSQGREMRTLTNRDGASIPMDRRARAIAAMQGTLRG